MTTAKWTRASLLGFVLCALSLADVPVGVKEIAGYPYSIDPKDTKYVCNEGAVEWFSVGTSVRTIKHNICISDKFSPFAQTILRKGWSIFLSNLTEKEIYECLSNNTRPSDKGLKPLKSWEDFISFFVDRPLSPEPSDPKDLKTLHTRSAYISGIDLQDGAPEVYGTGYLNFFDNPEFLASGEGWRRYISIGVRTDLVGIQNPSVFSDPSFWAGIIAYGYARNLGLTEDLANLPGSPLYEFTRCLYFQGKIPTEFTSVQRSSR